MNDGTTTSGVSAVLNARPRPGEAGFRVRTRLLYKAGRLRELALPALALILVGLIVLAFGPSRMVDFRGDLYNAGLDLIHGHDPYRAGFVAHQAALVRAGHLGLGELNSNSFSLPLYPAFANVLVVPLALLPFGVASVLWTLLSVLALVIGLRLLGVRDKRCVFLTLTSWPVLTDLGFGAISCFLLLGAAAAWRWRDQVFKPAVFIAAVIAAKIFPWPLAVWLLITRRYRAFAVTLGVGLIMTFGAWALVGFQGLAQYPQMMSDVSFIEAGRSVGIVGVLAVAGVPVGTAIAIAVLFGAALLGLAYRVASGPDGDRRAYGLAVLAALSASPIVWEHYMLLLFIPIALVSPEFSWVWAIPAAAPIVEGLIQLIPAGPDVPFSANLLRLAAPWLVLQLCVGVVVCARPVRRNDHGGLSGPPASGELESPGVLVDPTTPLVIQ